MSKITKKEIIEIADAIKEHSFMDDFGDSYIRKDDFVGTICDFLQRENPLFKRQLFLDYINGKCGPNGGEV